MKKILIVTIISSALMATSILLSYIPFVKEVITTPSYTAYEINSVDITQEDFLTYDLEVVLLDEDMNQYDDVKMYISSTENDQTQEAMVSYDRRDSSYFIDDFSIEKRGDYFIRAVFSVDGEEQVAVLQVTFPIMNPKIYINNGLNNIMFEVDGKTSWSSFIDPEGINVYRSSEYTFNDQARLLEENMRIIVQDYLDLTSTDTEPYYFVQFVSKGGRVTYTSSALFGETTQEDFNARFVTDFSGVTFLELSGSIYGPEEDNTKAYRDVRLRVGNYPDTQMVENSYTGEDSKRFKFLVNIEDLLREGSNNFVYFYTENGTMLEASIKTDGFDITSVVTKVNGSVYSLDNPNALIINRNFDITYSDLVASFQEKDDSVYLHVSGNAFLSDFSLVESIGLRIKGMEGIFTSSDVVNGTFDIEVDLSSLDPSANWQDITFILEEDGESYRVNLPSDQVDKGTFTKDGITYQFESWNNQLKLYKYETE